MPGTNPIATWLLSNFTTQDPTTYKGTIDGNFAVAQRFVNAFAPHAQSTPDMTVRLDAGFIMSGITLTEVAAQNTGTITAPVGNPRIDRIVVDETTGAVSVITGTPAGSPTAPAITVGKVPVAQVLLQTSSVAISNAMITDERVPIAKKELGAIGAEGTYPLSDPLQSSGLVWVPSLPKSLAPNPFFQINQRTAGAGYADGAYTCDRWYILTQTGTIAYSQQTLQENGQATNIRLTQSQASAQRFGLACVLEAKTSQAYRGRQFTFRPRVRISASQAIRIAVLEWTGTADTVTKDVVNSWTNSTYTAGQFFNSTTLTVSGVGAKTPSAATWTDMDALTVTLGSSVNNIILFMWVEQTAAQNVTFDIGKVRFSPGPYVGDILIPSYLEDWQEAMRFYQRYRWDSDGVGTIPGGIGYVNAATQALFSVPFPVSMRKVVEDANVSSTDVTALRVSDGSATGNASAISINNGGTAPLSDSTTTMIITTNSVLTAGRAALLKNDGSTPVDIVFNVDL